MQIILCATQRSGSTMIIEDMLNTGVLGNPEEWFIPWDPAKTHINWQEDLVGVKRRASGENGVMAIKVMANQLYNIDTCLAEAYPAQQGAEFGHFASAFHGASWIRIIRRDTVSQAISRLMAQQTGINHATARPEDEHFAGNLARGYDTNYNNKTKYRYEILLNYVTAIVLENLAWDRFFASHNITPVELIYEDIVKDTDMAYLDVIAGQIGLEGELKRQPRKMVKMGNNRNREWRERFFQEAAANRFLPTNSTF